MDSHDDKMKKIFKLLLQSYAIAKNNGVFWLNQLHWHKKKSNDKIITYAFFIHKWKRVYLQTWLHERKLIYVPFKVSRKQIQQHYLPKISQPDVEVLCWGMRLPEEVKIAARKITYVEDGFIRSVGLGSEHTLPLSLNFDSQTAYFNARESSDLEDILNNYNFQEDKQLMQRARHLREALLQTGLSKYNHNFGQDYCINPKPVRGQKIILVLGQVEDDASILYGCDRHYTNNDVVRIAAVENPDAYILYKPHPDILQGKRLSISEPQDVAELCVLLEQDIALSKILNYVDHVYTITSQAGFEALLRGIGVTTLGCPFYAGWGLTDDRQFNPRRQRKLAIDELLAGAYILYPQYFDSKENKNIEVEEAVNKLLVDIIHIN